MAFTAASPRTTDVLLCSTSIRRTSGSAGSSSASSASVGDARNVPPRIDGIDVPLRTSSRSPRTNASTAKPSTRTPLCGPVRVRASVPRASAAERSSYVVSSAITTGTKYAFEACTIARKHDAPRLSKRAVSISAARSNFVPFSANQRCCGIYAGSTSLSNISSERPPIDVTMPSRGSTSVVSSGSCPGRSASDATPCAVSESKNQ